MNDIIEPVLSSLWRASWQASVLALVLLLFVHWPLRDRLAARWGHALWLLVLLRLALPVVPQSPTSVFHVVNLARPPTETQAGQPIPLPVASFDIVADATAVVPSGPLDLSPAETATRSPVVSISLILAMIWSTGVAVMLARMAGSTGTMIFLRRRMRPVKEPRLIALLDACRQEMRVRRRVRLLDSDALAGPALCGLVRPALLLPERMSRTLGATELRMVMLHELGHLKRHDLLINWLSALILAMHWFNPIAWLAARRLRAEAELACDEMVLRRGGPAQRRVYGDVLLKVAEMISCPRLTPGTVGIVESSRQIRRRIMTIASFTPRSRAWSVVALVLSIVLSATFLTDVMGQSTQPAATAQMPEFAREQMNKTPRSVPATSPANQNEARQLLLTLEDQRRVVQEEIRALEDRVTEFRKANPRLNLEAVISQELQQLAKALVEARLALIDAKSSHAQGHPTILTAARKEQEVQALYDAALQKFMELNERAAEYVKLQTALAVRQDFLKRLDDRIRQLEVAVNSQPAPQPPVERIVLDEVTEQLNARIVEALERIVPGVRLEGNALSEAIEFIREIGGLNIVVEWATLEQVGISGDATVTVRLDGLPLNRVLAEILQSAGGGRLRHIVDRGVVRITTADEAARIVFTRSYNLRPITQDPSAVDNIIKLIQRTVAPQDWSPAGPAEISSFKDKLIITASDATHDQIRKLLARLREAPVTSPAGD